MQRINLELDTHLYRLLKNAAQANNLSLEEECLRRLLGGERRSRYLQAQLDDQAWEAIVAGFTAQVRAGQTLQGFLTCIGACGELLKHHVPRTQDRNELPNRLVIIN